MKPSISLVTLLALAGLAHADRDKDKAESLFKQGKKLMSEKRYSDACKAFEQSYKLDSVLGAQLNVALCYEEWGKLARAFRAYQQAEQMAKDTHDNREPKIHERLEALDPEVPRLTIKIPKGADTEGLVLTIDGAAVDTSALGEPLLVDPGPHQIEYQGAGGTKKTKIVPFERGGSSQISLDLPKAVAKPKLDDKPKVVETPDPGRTRRIVGLAVGGAGVAAIGVASYLALSAHSKYNDALETHCGNMTNGCDSVGLTATHDARHEANLATVVFSVGLAAVGGGVVLYLLAPHDQPAEHAALYLVPSIGPDGGGLVLGGRY